jgi:hypothetical protein
MLTIAVEYKELSRKINQFAVATGRTREDVTRQVLKNMVTSATKFTPPASAEATGRAAQTQGQQKIMSDLNKMGFRPVDIKHKENPLFADPDAYHHDYLSGNAIKTLFFVSKPKFKTMVTRLFAEIGKLTSGWTLAAVELAISLPAWVYRHTGENRGTVRLQRQENITVMTAINHVPDNATEVHGEMERRKVYWVSYARAGLERQLKAKLAGDWGR